MRPRCAERGREQLRAAILGRMEGIIDSDLYACIEAVEDGFRGDFEMCGMEDMAWTTRPGYQMPRLVTDLASIR